MAVSFTNNWKNILDKLESVMRTEFKGALKVYRGNKAPAGSTYLQLIPTGSELLEYNVTSETREFTIQILYYFLEANVKDSALDGTATYSVWVKNSDKLGIQQGNQVVTAEKINGDYQSLAGGLQIRFAGESKTSVATATNEWEIEVMGASEHIDASGVKSVQNSRWIG